MRISVIVLVIGVFAASVTATALPAGASVSVKGKPNQTYLCTTIKTSPSISTQGPQISPARGATRFQDAGEG